jgi:hypothetical protein
VGVKKCKQCKVICTFSTAKIIITVAVAELEQLCSSAGWYDVGLGTTNCKVVISTFARSQNGCLHIFEKNSAKMVKIVAFLKTRI